MIRKPNNFTKDVHYTVRVSGIYTCQTPPYHYRFIVKVLRKEKEKCQKVALDKCAYLLLDATISVTVAFVASKKMKCKRLKAVPFVSKQHQLTDMMLKDQKFCKECVRMDTIEGYGRYHGVFIFDPITLAHLVSTERITTCANASY